MKLFYTDSMKLHGDNAIKYLDFEPYEDGSPAMFWLYDVRDYERMMLHDGDKYAYFHGVDVLSLRQDKNRLPLLREANPVVGCHNHIQRDMLAEMGVYAHIRPIFWSDVSKYKPTGSALTKDIYLTSHSGRRVEYGEYMANTIAAACPDWTFHIFGTEQELPVELNVKYYGEVPEDEMDDITKNMAGTLRWKKINGISWDGFSQTSMKALMRGQSVISSIDYPYSGCFYVENIEDVSFRIQTHLGNIAPTDKGWVNIDTCIELNNFDWLKK